MVGELGQHDQRVLRDRQQSCLLRRHCDTGIGVHVDDELRILARGVDGGVDGEASRVDRLRIVVDLAAIEIDLH
jgi:hypothetical protein